jgi:hypothetical protein
VRIDPRKFEIGWLPCRERPIDGRAGGAERNSVCPVGVIRFDGLVDSDRERMCGGICGGQLEAVAMR